MPQGLSPESVARTVAMSGIAAERDEYRRQLDTLLAAARAVAFCGW